MMKLDIPNFAELELHHLVLDYNGTVACDGKLLPEVLNTLEALRHSLQVHVITADTHGTARDQIGDHVHLKILCTDDHTSEKSDFVDALGARSVIAVGNGRNDVEMLQRAAIGIAIFQAEGASALAVQHADIVIGSISEALALLTHPKRLIATLRG